MDDFNIIFYKFWIFHGLLVHLGSMLLIKSFNSNVYSHPWTEYEAPSVVILRNTRATHGLLLSALKERGLIRKPTMKEVLQIQSLLSSCSHLLLHLKRWPVFCLAFLSLISLFWYFKHNNSSKNQAMKHWPFLGNLSSFIKNSDRLCEWFTEVFSSLNKGSFYVGGTIFSKLRILVTCDVNNIEYILKTNFNNFPKVPYYNIALDIFGEGIFTVDSDLWQIQRRTAHSSFTSMQFRNLVAKTSRKVVEDQLIPFLDYVAKEGSTIDIQNVYSRLAYDLNMGILFGRQERYLSISLPTNELAEAGAIAEKTVLYRFLMPMFMWKLMRWLRVGSERQYAQACETLDSSYHKFISQKREDLFIKGIESFDLLSSYMKSSCNEDKTDKFLKDAMMNFSVAGKDTIASGLTWFFWLVDKNPSVEMKILEELKQLHHERSVAKETKWPWVFESEDLKGLVYLHASLCESLRLYPPVPLNLKSVTKEELLPDGSLVKPGMEIFLSFYSVGRMSWIWGEDCLEFKPERWIDSETGKLNLQLMSKFFVFNFGPRNCIGKDITFTEMKSVVAGVLFNFHVQVVEGHKVCPKLSLTYHMENGLMVNVRRRTTMST